MGYPCAQCKKQCSAEFLGPFLLVLIGPGTAAFMWLNSIPHQLLVIATSFGGIVAPVILVVGKISRAHINPAVTLAQTLTGKLSRGLLARHIPFQLAAGSTAGLVLRFMFPLGAKSNYPGSTALADYDQPSVGFALEGIATFVLLFIVLHVSSKSLPVKRQDISKTLGSMYLVQLRERFLL